MAAVILALAAADRSPQEQLDFEPNRLEPAAVDEPESIKPRCSLQWEGNHEPTWRCDGLEFLANYSGDVCDALREGDPSVYDYATSWNRDQSGFMYLPERRDSEELLARFALAHHVAEQQRESGHDADLAIEALTGSLHNIALAVDSPTRAIQQDMAGPMSEAVQTWTDGYERHCAGSGFGDGDAGTIGNGSEGANEQTEYVAPSDDVVEVFDSYEGLFEVECTRASLGSLADHPYQLSEFPIRNQDFFRDNLFYGIGVLLDRDDWVNDYGEEGIEVAILVVAGQPGEMNYSHGAGYALPGDVQRFTAYGGDSMILGDPSPGDLLMWFAAGSAYGWASWREPTLPESVTSQIAAAACDAVWEE